MKSELSENKIDEEKELEFPLLMKSPYTDRIYLVTKRNEDGYSGVELYGIEVGKIHIYLVGVLTHYEGSITLSN